MPYVCGLDLGQAQDYTALTIVETHGDPVQCDVIELRRWPLGTDYPSIVRDVQALLDAPPLCVPLQANPLVSAQTPLVVDATGVGKAVVDMFRAAGVHPLMAVTIHGGDRVSREGQDWRVPKRDLVGVVQVGLQERRLQIVQALPEAATLAQELRTFRQRIDPVTAHDSYSHWREGQHDDLVLAVALACWWGTGHGQGRAGTWGQR